MKKGKFPVLRQLCNATTSNDQRSLLTSAGGLGVAVSPPVSPGQSPGGGLGSEAP